MLHLQAFKYELMPNGRQQRDMRRFAGSCRFVFNEALALQKARHQQEEKKLGYAGLCKLLTEWRNSPETIWLKDAPVHPLQQSLRDLERAYTNFFAKRANFPRFKKKGRHDSFRYPDPKQIALDQGNSRIFLPKLGWLRYRNSREVLGAVKNVTVSLSCGKWYVSLQTEREVADPIHPTTSAIGIDLGVREFAALSDGAFVAPANSYRTHEARLARYQRVMSRKQTFSNNWKKAKARVQRLHRKIANIRRDHLHKTSTAICNTHARIVIEDLKIRTMVASAAGTTEEPGTLVKITSRFNTAILDQGWYEFRRQLEYKAQWIGGEVIALPQEGTSTTCPECDHDAPDNRPNLRKWFKCVACGHREHSGTVAAKNLLRRAGHARLACQASGAVMPPATGTRRSDSGGNSLPRLNAVGIPDFRRGRMSMGRAVTFSHLL